MASPTGILPEDMYSLRRTGDVLRFLAALPIPGDDKVNILAGYALWMGIKYNSGQIEKLRSSGTDRQATGGR
jgi:hypothetical protein